MKNNTIALLIGVFIIIMIASFFTAPQSIVRITGLASSGTSSTAFNITEEVSILVSGTIDFGVGRVDPNATNTTIDSALGKYDYDLVNITSEVGDMPSRRLFGDMSFDNDRGIVVSYGGFIAGPSTYYNDTWEFDYSAKDWTRIASADNSAELPGGGGLAFAPLAYNSDANRVILFGGQVSGGTKVGGTWEYNGTNWTKRNPDTSPPNRSSTSMVYDSNRNVIVLFGGAGNGGKLADTWEYDYSANNWTNVTPSTSPSARNWPGLAYDSERNEVILFGGQDANNDYVNDTWVYDGTSWTDISNSVRPSNRLGVINYDPLRDRTLLIGGDNGTYLTDVWDFDNEYDQWHRIYDDESIQKIGGTLFDSVNNVTIMFVGTGDFWDNSEYVNETWQLNYSVAGGLVNGTWFPYKDYFFLENDGTVNVSINFTADKNAGQFIGGTSPVFAIKGVVTESDACPSLVTSYTDVPNSTETPQNLCPLLKFGPQTSDEFSIATKLVVPSDIQAGGRTATITFAASKV